MLGVFAARIASFRTWALFAQLGLGANVAVDLLDLTLRWGTDVEHANVALLDFTTLAQSLAWVLTAVFFLRWIYLLVRETKGQVAPGPSCDGVLHSPS